MTWVGEVIGASDGVIRVAWGDGSISNCHPKFAWVVSHDDDDSEHGAVAAPVMMAFHVLTCHSAQTFLLFVADMHVHDSSTNAVQPGQQVRQPSYS